MMSMGADGLYVFLGGSRGLGVALAKGLARPGGLAVLASRNAEELEEARRQVERARWARVVTEVVDLSNPGELPEFAERLAKYDLPLRLLVNTAAGFFKGNFADLEPAGARNLINTTYSSFALLLLEVVKKLDRSELCDVINVTSISSATSLDGSKSSALHISTKAAAHTLGIIVGREVVGSGLRITSLAPGTFARKGRVGVAEATLVRIARFLVDLPRDAWIEELVIRPTGLLEERNQSSRE